MERVELIFPLAKKNFMLARLLCGGVGSLMNYNIETVEDVKVAINEACIILFMQGYREAKIVLEMDEKLLLCATGSVLDVNTKSDKDFSFAMSLLSELVSDVIFETENDAIKSIQFCVNGN